MMTRGWRHPTLLQLTYYGNPSSRMRAIKMWGSKIPAPDRRQATQRRVFEGKFINGKRVIGTYADKKSMTLHTLDQPSTSVYSGGRPYVATGPGEDERETCSGISPVSHPSDEVKASCLKLIKQTDAFVHRMHAAGVFDAALFENVKACIDAW